MTYNPDEDVEDAEEYSDTDLGAVDEHKSIILHLLSQLKLGMDLTKVLHEPNQKSSRCFGLLNGQT